jgi:hypothetical protein
MTRGTVPDPYDVIDRLRASNDVLRSELRNDGRPRRAFWRGVVIGGLLTGAAFFANTAFGETVSIGRHFINGEPTIPSSVTISPSDQPGQLAIVTFVNRYVNQREDDGTREIATVDVSVSVKFTFDFNGFTGADRIDVTPPAGVTCDPTDCGVTVMEGFTGQVVLFQWQGM